MSSTWAEPLPFIITEGDMYIVNTKTAKLLSAITKPIIPVAIAGTYRTGKSYLMNRLARRKTGFPLGNTVQSVTKGIWVWCCDHPLHTDKVLLLLDTEGLDDPEKGDATNDMTIFSLAVLLCSTFIFNAIGRIDQEMIKKLHFVTDLTERIRVRSRTSATEEDGGSTYNEFTEHFPRFVLVVRDLTLELKIGEKSVTADQYFDHVLELQKGSSKRIVEYNLPRDAIRNAFRSHNCIVFPRPVSKDEMFQKLEELPETQLSQAFLEQSKVFCDFIFEKSSEKLLCGRNMNGRLFLCLAEQYLAAINSGAVPCIESTITLVAEKENKRLYDESLSTYREQMSQIDLPTTHEKVDAAHKKAYDFAVEYFRCNVVFDENGEFIENLLKAIETVYGEILTSNEEASTTFCESFLAGLYSDIISERMCKQEYTSPGGYKHYEDDMQKLKQAYESQDGKGVMAEFVFNNFINEKQSERDTILSADTLLSKKEKEIEAAKKAKEAAEVESRLKQKALEEENKRVKEMDKQHQEQLDKLKEENDQQLKNTIEDLEATLKAKLKEQEKLLEQGYTERAAEMQGVIDRLTEECKPSKFLKIVDTFANVTSAIGTFGMGYGGLKSMGSGLKSIGGRALGFLRRFI